MIGVGISVTLLHSFITSDTLMFNGEPITYNGQIINDMASIIEIYDKRTATVTIPADGTLVVDGEDVAGNATGEPVTARTARGIVMGYDGKQVDLSWAWTDPEDLSNTELTIDNTGGEELIGVTITYLL